MHLLNIHKQNLAHRLHNRSFNRLIKFYRPLFNYSYVKCSIHHWWVAPVFITDFKYCCSVQRKSVVTIGQFKSRTKSSWINHNRSSNNDCRWRWKVSYFSRISVNAYIKLILSMVTETWQLQDGNNKMIQPILDGYRDGVALYAVNFDFCRKNV